MRPLPDLKDKEAMAARGRRSALMQARKELLESMRDTLTHLQTSAIEEMDVWADDFDSYGPRLREISEAWRAEA